MAIDKVKPLKIETSVDGTENDFFQTEVSPSEDYIASKGLALENNDNRTIDLDGSGNIQFKDATETTAITVRQLRTAINNLFDNTSNGFTATNVQTGIEEAKNTATGLPRFTIVTSFNGTVSNNQWLGYNELIPGNVTPIVVPVKCKLTEISVSFNGSSVDGRLDVYKNGTNPGDIVVNTFTFTNVNTSQTVTGLNVSLNPGDNIRGRWIDSGENPSDMAVVYYFTAIA